MLNELCHDCTCTGIDIDAGEKTGSNPDRFVNGNGGALPFRPGSFDIALTVDTFEHVPPPSRDAFLEEMNRVARKSVILASPFKSSPVEEAEDMLAEFWRASPEASSPHLAEHRRFGLPSLEETLGWFRKKGWSVTTLPNGYLRRWLLMMILSGIIRTEKSLKDFTASVNALYNRTYYRLDNREPSYRTFLVCYRGAFPSSGISEQGGGRIPAGRGGGALDDDLEILLNAGYISVLLEIMRLARLREKDETIEHLEKILAEKTRAEVNTRKEMNGLKSQIANLDESIRQHQAALKRADLFRRKIERSFPYKVYRKLLPF